MARGPALLLVLALALGGCGPDVPELDARIEAEGRGSYPDLVPLGPLLDTVDATATAEAVSEEGPSIEDRAEELRRRAAQLRGRSL
jgi:hypothetical protein